MAQFWRTRQFKQVSLLWNQRLLQSGFIDAEVEIKGDRVLKQKATNAYRQAGELERNSRFEYYRCLGILINETIFPTELEKKVMVKHSEGATVKEILQEVKVIKKRHTITYIIRRWQMKWGIKHWSAKQMNLKKITG